MKIAILARNPGLYSHIRLVETAIARGHDACIIDTSKCYMQIASGKISIWYKGQELTDIDAIIPRIGPSITLYGTAVVRQFELLGTYSINSAAAISHSRDKFWCLQLLASQGIGIPTTSFGYSQDNNKDLIEKVGGAPLIIKLLEGTQGLGVVLAQSDAIAENVIEAFKGVKANILIQEYIKEASGSDIRCLVIGGKVVAAMERKAMTPGEFRANIHRGGIGQAVSITEEESEMASKVATFLGLNMAGVDILRSQYGPIVIEVNSSPGFKGIESVSNKNIAEYVIEHIENSVIKL